MVKADWIETDTFSEEKKEAELTTYVQYKRRHYGHEKFTNNKSLHRRNNELQCPNNLFPSHVLHPTIRRRNTGIFGD